MFAVFKTGGKQYRVAAEDKIQIAKIKGEPGEIVEFGEVLLVGGDNVLPGSPTVEGASVAAEVLDHGRGPKIISFKKRRRKNSRRKRGHRQEFTLVRITEILTEGRKANKTAPPRPQREKKPAPTETGEAGEETASEKKTKRATTSKKSKKTARPAAKVRKKPPAAKKKPQPRGKK